MFTRLETNAGQAYWRSSLLDQLGVPHVFTSRSWNVKTDTDVASVVGESGLGRDAFPDGHAASVVLSKQVHGCGVSGPDLPLAEADAHVTNQPHSAVAVRTADCVPILLSTPDGKAVAAIHAGWRGLDPDIGVIQNAVAALCGLCEGRQASELIAAIGPCISAERYEVGEEVAGRFRGQTPQAVRDDLGSKPHLDTRAVAMAQLIDTGRFAGADSIDVFPGCTFDDAEDCFSYRRDGPGVGHHAAVIAIKPG